MPNKNDTTATSELHAAEKSIEAHSAVFKKELGLADLVLTQILFIVGLSWVGTAAANSGEPSTPRRPSSTIR